MKTSARFIVLFALISIIPYACKKENLAVPIQIKLTDNPTSYDSVLVHLKSINIKTNDESAGWTAIRTRHDH